MDEWMKAGLGTQSEKLPARVATGYHTALVEAASRPDDAATEPLNLGDRRIVGE